MLVPHLCESNGSFRFDLELVFVGVGPDPTKYFTNLTLELGSTGTLEINSTVSALVSCFIFKLLL